MNYPLDKVERHKEITMWIEKVIDSCQTWEQTKTAFALVSNFEKRLMGDKDFINLRWSTSELLIDKLGEKRINLLN